MPKVKYGPGDLFAVPLSGGGYGLGLIARANPRGVMLGYFFGPKRTTLPTREEVSEPGVNDAVLVGRFGDLHLKRGKWPTLGKITNWQPDHWPMPEFVRTDPLMHRSFRMRYDDTDPNLLISEEIIPVGEETLSHADGLMGAGYVEDVLADLLASS